MTKGYCSHTTGYKVCRYIVCGYVYGKSIWIYISVYKEVCMYMYVCMSMVIGYTKDT